VQHTALSSSDWAQDGVSRGPVSECFPPRCVLLVSVGEGDVHPCLHVIQGTRCGGWALNGGAAECGVMQSEGLASPPVGCSGEGVFARSAEEVESQDAQVPDGFSLVPGWVPGHPCCQGPEDGDVDGPNS
jgi:hypothetical protein